MSEKDVQAELENLKAELAMLRADRSGVASALKGLGMAEAGVLNENASDFAARAKEELKHLLAEARAKGKKSVEVVEGKVAEHPFVSLLAAFGVGFLVAKLLDRK